MAGKIPLYKIFTDREDNRAVNKVLQRGMDWAIGHEIAEFEKKLQIILGLNIVLHLILERQQVMRHY